MGSLKSPTLISWISISICGIPVKFEIEKSVKREREVTSGVEV